jgi:hypothetical protein
LLINKQKEIDLEAISHKLYKLINYKSYFNYTKKLTRIHLIGELSKELSNQHKIIAINVYYRDDIKTKIKNALI